MKVKELASLIVCAYSIYSVDQDGVPNPLYFSWNGNLPENIAEMQIESIDRSTEDIIINV